MKKHLLIFLLIFLWMAAAWLPAEPAFADPPQDLSLSYDLKTQTLSASITHKSTFTGFHYIKQVQIKKIRSRLKPPIMIHRPAKPPSSIPTKCRRSQTIFWK